MIEERYWGALFSVRRDQHQCRGFDPIEEKPDGVSYDKDDCAGENLPIGLAAMCFLKPLLRNL